MAYVRMIIGVLIAIGVLAGISASVQAQSDDGLVAEWHFDEGSGSVLKDSSGNGNDGVIYGATWVDGRYEGALSFDGINNYVDMGDVLDFDGIDNFTICGWSKYSITNTYASIVTKEQANAPWTGYALYSNYAGVVKAYMREGNDNKEVDTPSAPYADGEWHYYVMVNDGSNDTLYLYIDGNFIGRDTNLNVDDCNTVAHLNIGTRDNLKDSTGGKWCFNGVVDEVRIYNRALFEEELKEHFEQGPTTLSVIKTVSPQSIKQGQTTTIILTVKNTGTTEIKDIEIADTIPSYLTFIDGEDSKRYDSLAPKDTRKISYTLQLNDTGTFNLEPAIAAYADDKGNYNIVKSKPVSIEVIRSIIENSAPTPKPMNGYAQTASVHLHGEKTDVVKGEDILLKLAAVNLITKPTMHVQVIITPPSGMSVTSSEFVTSGAGLFTASYEIEPGVGRDIEVKMRSNQVGDFVVNGRIVYYFGDVIDDVEDHTLTLPITVRAGPVPTVDISGSEGTSTPGFAALVAVIGLLLAYLRRRA